MPDLNSLSLYDIAYFKSENYFSSGKNNEPSRKNIAIVAEGDSWFDYPPGIDILDYLAGYFNYNVVKLGKHGDRLLNMVYGKDGNTGKNNLEYIKQFIKQKRADFFLFSGGGNDFAGGDQFGMFLKFSQGTGDDAASLIKRNVLDDFMGELKKALDFMINELIKVNKKIKILMHGYGYAIPDGRPVIYVMGSLPWMGPWLKPALDNRGISDFKTGKKIVDIVMDAFNEMLGSLENEYGGIFYHVDLRNVIKKGDWVNELHVNNETYKKIAQIFHEEFERLSNG